MKLLSGSNPALRTVIYMGDNVIHDCITSHIFMLNVIEKKSLLIMNSLCDLPKCLHFLVCNLESHHSYMPKSFNASFKG